MLSEKNTDFKFARGNLILSRHFACAPSVATSNRILAMFWLKLPRSLFETVVWSLSGHCVVILWSFHGHVGRGHFMVISWSF